jgi:CRISPR/Cas system CMR subunit Cmr4 (Cas7 group RAMP superfamily)
MAMPKKLERFEVTDGQEVLQVALLQVDADVGRKALAEYNRAFSAAVHSGALLRSALQNHMREQNVWNDEKEEQYTKLVSRINENADKLARGGIKLSDARTVAIDSRSAREELRELITERSMLDSNTAEGQAENARFNFIVAEVTVNDSTGDRYFKNLDDYLSQSSSELAVESATRLGRHMYGLDPDYEKGLPENKFLVKWKFADEELRLVNKEGKLVDSEGRRINKDGRLVNDDDELVDVDGNLVTEEGDLVVEAQPFLDDDGTPISDPDDDSPAKEKQEEEFGKEEIVAE